MNRILITLLTVSLFLSCEKPIITPDPDPTVDGTGFVRVKDGKLVNENDQPFELRSTNIGGWLLWEGWIMGGGLNSEKEVFKNIENKTSKTFADNFRQRMYNEFITEADIIRMKECGLNSVCINLNHRVLDNDVPNGNIIDANFAPLDKVIDLCKKHGMYAIVEMHAAPGGQSPYFVADPDDKKLWDNEDNKNQLVKLWTAIANRYKDNKTVAAYDLLGEPSPWFAADLIELYGRVIKGRVIKGIRSVDKSHMLMLQATDFTKKLDIFSKPLDNNQIFSVHFYTWYLLIPIAESEWVKDFEKFDAFSKKMGVPVYIGEWGEASVGDLTKVAKYIRDPKYNFCGDAFWTWKKVQITDSPALNNIKASDDWKRLIKGEAKQSSKTYEQIADEFLQNSKIENTTFNTELKNIILSN